MVHLVPTLSRSASNRIDFHDRASTSTQAATPENRDGRRATGMSGIGTRLLQLCLVRNPPTLRNHGSRGHVIDMSFYRRPLRYERYWSDKGARRKFEWSVFVSEREKSPVDQAEADAWRSAMEDKAFTAHFVWATKALHLYTLSRVFSPEFGNIAYLKECGLQKHHAMFESRLKVAVDAMDGIDIKRQLAIRTGAGTQRPPLEPSRLSDEDDLDLLRPRRHQNSLVA